MQAPQGNLITEGHYYEFASVFFYTNRTGLLLGTNRRLNLDYGSAAPGAPEVFIEGSRLKELWIAPARQYLLINLKDEPYYEGLVAPGEIVQVAESGGKLLLTNHPVNGS